MRPDDSWWGAEREADASADEEASAVDHKLSVVVRVEVDGNAVQLVATGCLTEDSQQALLSLIRQARAVNYRVQVTVDLTGTHHVEPAGLNRLRSAVDHDEHEEDPGQPVLFVVPEPLPVCPSPDDEGQTCLH